MSSQRVLILQEIRARLEFIVGTALTNPQLQGFDNLANPRWVQAVEISSTRPLQDVPVKAVNGSRSYARRGATVLLRRNAQGRFEVVAAGDRVAGTLVDKTYTFGNTTPLSSADEGYTSRREVFDFYKGSGPPNSLWNDGFTPFPKITIIDANGDPVV